MREASFAVAFRVFAGFVQASRRLLKFDLKEGEGEVVGIYHIMFDASFTEIRNAGGKIRLIFNAIRPQ